MLGFASACFFGLLAVLSMIYLRAAAWFFIAGLAFSLGSSLWSFLTKNAHLKKQERLLCSIGLVVVIFLLGWTLMAFVPLIPNSPDKKVEQQVIPIPLTLRLDLLTFFPISVAPHTTVYALPMHHKISEKDWGMADISNYGDQPKSWPEKTEFQWRNATEIEQTMAIDLRNESNIDLVNVQCMIKFEFLQAIREGTSIKSGSSVATINHLVNIPRMPASSIARIYFLNQSPHHFMKVHFPNEASLLAVGETDRRNTKILKTGIHWIETFQNFALNPTNVRWRGSGISD